ncbi:hypothetical protein JOC36_000937 [Weissella uvarum]|uniref:hypothetical protein n=1 Tax=Weissella uvarum TaxID=1479233 RepID=UPI00195F85F7|nr:hypothetical protein [Weissella uvarum]MBM7617380.1 hypothetical protein [Weissella uvarum]MCM0595734.1 hypothetical protein [Weissella uvarum]
MQSTIETANQRILTLLQLPNSTVINWYFNVAIDWYVKVKGYAYQVIMNDNFQIEDISELKIIKGS